MDLLHPLMLNNIKATVPDHGIEVGLDGSLDGQVLTLVPNTKKCFLHYFFRLVFVVQEGVCVAAQGSIIRSE